MMKEQWLNEVNESWTLFLDRDGVINKKLDNDYVKHINEFEFLEGAIEAIYLLTKLFNHTIVVTNQQGVGKGIMSHEDLALIHEYMLYELEKAHAFVDQIYYSPDLAHLNSFTRKPNPGMAIQAQTDFPDIDFSRSIMVGDSSSDIDFGDRLGMKTVLVTNTFQYTSKADLQVGSLSKFADLLI